MFRLMSCFSCDRSDIKGALSSLLRTISAEDDGNSIAQTDKIPAVARDGADARPLSATPSILGGSAARRSTKSELPADAAATVALNPNADGQPHQPAAPRGSSERPHTHLRSAQET